MSNIPEPRVLRLGKTPNKASANTKVLLLNHFIIFQYFAFLYKTNKKKHQNRLEHSLVVLNMRDNINSSHLLARCKQTKWQVNNKQDYWLESLSKRIINPRQETLTITFLGWK